MGYFSIFKDGDEKASSRKEEGKEEGTSRVGREPYERVGAAEKNGHSIFNSPDNGNELGMNSHNRNWVEDSSRGNREGENEGKVTNRDATEQRKQKIDSTDVRGLTLFYSLVILFY